MEGAQDSFTTGCNPTINLAELSLTFTNCVTLSELHHLSGSSLLIYETGVTRVPASCGEDAVRSCMECLWSVAGLCLSSFWLQVMDSAWSFIMEVEMLSAGVQFASVTLAHSQATWAREGNSLSCKEGGRRWLGNKTSIQALTWPSPPS